jgi:hypothetical protein
VHNHYFLAQKKQVLVTQRRRLAALEIAQVESAQKYSKSTFPRASGKRFRRRPGNAMSGCVLKPEEPLA